MLFIWLWCCDDHCVTPEHIFIFIEKVICSKNCYTELVYICFVENVGRLKKLEYLNLALNNIELIENLEGIPPFHSSLYNFILFFNQL